MYCDFTGNTTYEALGMGNYMVTYMGYSIVTLADFQKPNFPAAFITLYNSQGGMPALEAWHSGNCCFTTTGGADFKFSGDHPQPATAGGLMCNQSPTYNTPPYFFYMLGAVQAPPLPATFFSGGVTTDTACQDGVGSPAFFVRKSTIN